MALYSSIQKRQTQADLVTDGEYENYELSIDWKIAEGGNSGIILACMKILL
jgi:hypothetical protein